MAEVKRANMYSRGKIYKIWSPSTDDVYVGSTCEPTLARRMAGHRKSYRHWKKTGKHYLTSFEILEHGDARIELIEACPCETRDQLRAREGHWIRATGNRVNHRVAGRTDAEYRRDNRESLMVKCRRYRADNRGKAAARDRQYYQDNRARILVQKKQYQAKNKGRIAARQKQKTNCPCGSQHTRNNKSRHLRSKKHKRWLDAQPVATTE